MWNKQPSIWSCITDYVEKHKFTIKTNQLTFEFIFLLCRYYSSRIDVTSDTTANRGALERSARSLTYQGSNSGLSRLSEILGPLGWHIFYFSHFFILTQRSSVKLGITILLQTYLNRSQCLVIIILKLKSSLHNLYISYLYCFDNRVIQFWQNTFSQKFIRTKCIIYGSTRFQNA